MATEITVSELKDKIGEEISVGNWLEMTQDRINQFAECTGDHQWIHVDLEKAAKGPFGKFEIEGVAKPACVAETLSMVYV